MRFDSLKELKCEAFRRLTGVQRSTFEAMTALLLPPNASRGLPEESPTRFASKISF
jgi:hypothetical protein